MGSPPPAGSKNEVFIFRSVKSIVIAPAKTGRDRSNRIVVKIIDHTNRGVFDSIIDFGRILTAVEIKLIAPKIDEAPAR